MTLKTRIIMTVKFTHNLWVYFTKPLPLNHIINIMYKTYYKSDLPHLAFTKEQFLVLVALIKMVDGTGSATKL